MTENKIDKVSKDFTSIIKSKLKNHLKKIILFGSHARGDSNDSSDYDILIIVDKWDKNIKEIVLVIEEVNCLRMNSPKNKSINAKQFSYAPVFCKLGLPFENYTCK